MRVAWARSFVFTGCCVRQLFGGGFFEPGTRWVLEPLLGQAAVVRCRPGLLLRGWGLLMGSCSCEPSSAPPLTTATGNLQRNAEKIWGFCWAALIWGFGVFGVVFFLVWVGFFGEETVQVLRSAVEMIRWVSWHRKVILDASLLSS